MVLGSNWFYRPRIDLELKRYEALAFVQYLEKCLESKIIAPPMNELSNQIEVLSFFLEQSSHNDFALTKELKSVELSAGKINYEFHKDHVLQELETIAGFLLKKIKPYENHFTSLKKQILNEIKVETVGLIPAYTQEGWIILNDMNSYLIYRFNSTWILNQTGNSDFRIEFHSQIQHSINSNPEKIKLDLIQQNKNFPNPLTYCISLSENLPIQETCLPLAIEKIKALA